MTRQMLGGSPDATRADFDALARLAAQSDDLRVMFELMAADHDGAQGAGHWRTVVAQTFDRISRPHGHTVDVLSAIPVPMLLLVGDRDPFCTDRASSEEKIMSWYGDRVLPRIIDVACGTKAEEPWRRRACAGLAGEVVEIGFGSGLNVPFYPPGVTRVAAIEPSDLGWKLADERISTTSVPVQRSGRDGQALPFPDDSVDAALSTWTLCTIPVSKPILGGCHLTRPIVELLTAAGFVIEELDVFYADGVPRFAGAMSLGTALSP